MLVILNDYLDANPDLFDRDYTFYQIKRVINSVCVGQAICSLPFVCFLLLLFIATCLNYLAGKHIFIVSNSHFEHI